MRTIILASLALLISVSARADDAGSCYVIAHPDSRAYCLAKAHKDPGRCYSIQSTDKRAACLAEVRN